MRIAGIVAEYNPFHLGHAWQIARTREQLGPDGAIVCVMSGDFVQRGEPAMFSKYARAAAAVRCGADLVIELPVPWCIGSAERFARGAVDLLGGLGVVDVLSFGSESGDPAALERIAACLDSGEYQAGLSRFLDEGLSFAACRQAVVREVLGPEDAELLSGPNDNLAVEYLRAVRRGGYAMEPLAIRRTGTGHDQIGDGPIRSGSQLRAMAEHGEDLANFLPMAAYDEYRQEIEQGRGPVFPEHLELPILSRLRMLEEDTFSELPDAGEGLEHRLYAACREAPDLQSLYTAVKSKRYAHARIRRMVLCAALDVRKQDFLTTPPYARILALNAAGAAVIRQVKSTGNSAVISKSVTVRKHGPDAERIFQLTSNAHDLYVLAYKNAGFRAGEQDWRESPRRICEQTIEFS